MSRQLTMPCSSPTKNSSTRRCILQMRCGYASMVKTSSSMSSLYATTSAKVAIQRSNASSGSSATRCTSFTAFDSFTRWRCCRTKPLSLSLNKSKLPLKKQRKDPPLNFESGLDRAPEEVNGQDRAVGRYHRGRVQAQGRAARAEMTRSSLNLQ